MSRVCVRMPALLISSVASAASSAARATDARVGDVELQRHDAGQIELRGSRAVA